MSRDRVVGCQRALHIALAERQPGLQQVAAHRAQHTDLPGAERGGEQQAIESVVLDLAAPHGEKGFDEARLDMGNIEVMAEAMLNLEILHAGRLRQCQQIRMFGQNAQAEVFHHRQQIRDRYRRTRFDEFEIHARERHAARSMQVQP